MTPHYTHTPFERTNAPSHFPRGPQPDVFPVQPERALVAVTVFTTYDLPAPVIAGQPYAPPAAGAICACGDAWRGDSAILLRKILGGHSCVAERGRPIELVPADDPTDEIVARLLDGLRRLP